MNKNLLSKTLIMGIVVLFIGVGIYPAIAVEAKSSIVNKQSENDCGCQVKNGYKQVIAERLLARLEVYINKILSGYRHIPEIEDKYNEILDIINSDRPICDLILQMNASIMHKVQDIWDLIPQYEDNPIIKRILLYRIMILLYIDVHLVMFWALLECGDWP